MQSDPNVVDIWSTETGVGDEELMVSWSVSGESE